MHRLILTILIFVFGNTQSQICKTMGEWCSDDYLCCGGCCIQNECVQTYADCHTLGNLCEELYCPADSVCKLYKPKCQGCEIERECVFVNQQEPTDNDDDDIGKSLPGFYSTGFKAFPCQFILLFSIFIVNFT